MFVIRVSTVFVALLLGIFPSATGQSASSTHSRAASGGWRTTTPMSTARAYHAAVLLPTGEVLVAGGRGCKPATRCQTAELYNPTTATWRSAGRMSVDRAEFTATLLTTGKVLVAGGTCTPSEVCSSAELYDPATNSWSATAGMSVPRTGHSATLLPNGDVLVAGGEHCLVAARCVLSSAETYHPATGTWTPVASMHHPHQDHTATLLHDGKVLVVGGYGCPRDNPCRAAEVFDPQRNRWQVTGRMTNAREGHTATLLPSGQVVVTGGEGCGRRNWCFSAERFDPKRGRWAALRRMSTTREDHTASLLTNGTVLVVGGQQCASSRCVYRNSSEVFRPSTGRWYSAGRPGMPVAGAQATLLPSGRVLLTGGETCQGGNCRSVPYAALYSGKRPVAPLDLLGAVERR